MEYKIKWRGGHTSTEPIEESLQLLTQAVAELLTRNVPMVFLDEFPGVEEISVVIYSKNDQM